MCNLYFILFLTLYSVFLVTFWLKVTFLIQFYWLGRGPNSIISTTFTNYYMCVKQWRGRGHREWERDAIRNLKEGGLYLIDSWDSLVWKQSVLLTHITRIRTIAAMILFFKKQSMAIVLQIDSQDMEECPTDQSNWNAP